MQHFIKTSLAALTLTSGVLAADGAPMPSDEGLIEARQAIMSGFGGAIMLRHMEDYFPTKTVSKGESVWHLENSDKSLNKLSFTFDETEFNLDEFYVKNRTNALIVLKDGKVVHEVYRNGGNEWSKQNSFSTNKSVISTLIGIALHEGKIKSLDQDITDYLPDLKGGGYEGVTIRDALQMASGVNFVEDYVEGEETPEGYTDLFEAFAPLFSGVGAIEDAAKTIKRSNDPGTKFNYSSLETEILGAIVEAATGMDVADYLSEKIWKPAGMQSEAYYTLAGDEATGDEMAAGGLSSTLRDYARFGQMMANGGKANGKQIVPTAWVKEATNPDPNKPFLAPGAGEVGGEQGYQHQWWLLPDGKFTAMGIFGQFIYVDPSENLVIATNSYWEEAWIDAHEARFLAFADAVRNHLK